MELVERLKKGDFRLSPTKRIKITLSSGHFNGMEIIDLTEEYGPFFISLDDFFTTLHYKEAIFKYLNLAAAVMLSFGPMSGSRFLQQVMHTSINHILLFEAKYTEQKICVHWIKWNPNQLQVTYEGDGMSGEAVKSGELHQYDKTKGMRLTTEQLQIVLALASKLQFVQLE